jgi:hypothetical protein
MIYKILLIYLFICCAFVGLDNKLNKVNNIYYKAYYIIYVIELCANLDIQITREANNRRDLDAGC